MTAPGLRAARLAAMMTQTELAQAARISRGTVARIEAGAVARLATIRRLALALGVEAIALTRSDEIEIENAR